MIRHLSRLMFSLALISPGLLPAMASQVILGDERIEEPQVLSLLEGKRLGILSHHAARDRSGHHIVDRLTKNAAFDLRMIFAPEHGYRGVDDVLLPDTRDSETGLPVYSLYGPRKAPTAEMLSRIDTILIDLQDVGLRYYTYPATVVYTLRAAKAAGKPVILLDRPNPLGGEIVDGATLEPRLASGGLTSIAQIPTRHGLTLGELSLYLNHHLGIQAHLTVIAMKGWKRSMRWQDTGLPWTPSSPALLSEDQVYLYSFLGTLESIDLAVGRGQSNTEAFRIYGAPWITEEDQQLLVRALNALSIPDVTFKAHTWTPDRARHLKQLCRGFRIEASPAASDRLSRDAISVYLAMERVLGSKISFDRGVTMLGGRWLASGIENGEDPSFLLSRIARENEEFRTARAPFLIY